ncbi:MAG: site-specific integrase [Bacteroidota bacterium]|nr:site-specific integrase [Bacteroidota bacterium]
MYQTFSLRFSASSSRAGKNGLTPLFLTISVGNQRVCIQLPKKVDPRDFNVKSQRSSNDDINSYMNVVRSRIFEIQTQLFAQGIPVTAFKIKEIFNGVQIHKEWGLLEFYEHHNEEMKKLVGHTIVEDSFKKHVYVLNYLRSYLNNADKPLNELTSSFLNSFYNYLIHDKGQCNNTAVGCMKKIKKIINLAVNDNLIQRNPFSGIKYKLDKVTPTYLSEDEIVKIWQKQFSSKRIEQVKDVYIFNCLTGLAFIDCKNLTKEQIFTDNQGGLYIKKPRQKTKVMATIPLNEIALSILEKYNFSLPVLSNQRMNSYLKEIADICGINKTLTTHTARHSAATLLLNHGANLSTVSAVLGHSNIKMTQHYAKLIDQTVINEIKRIKLLANDDSATNKDK